MSNPSTANNPPKDDERAEEIEPLTSADDAILDAIWARIAAQGRRGDLSGKDEDEQESVE